MKKSIFSLYFVLISLALSAQDFERIEPFNLKPLEIECTITCENAALGFYEISWSVPYIDSMAKVQERLPSMELHCFVRDAAGIIGSYEGLSTPMQHCAFQTKDAVVEVFFRLRRIPFYAYKVDSVEWRVSVINSSLYTPSHRGSEFESLHLAVNSTKAQKLTLSNDTNTVLLSYGSHPRLDPLGYPTILGESTASVISLDRHYLNLKTGRIATGQHWVNRKGPQEISRNIDQFLLISPSMQYSGENNNQYLGAELIQARKIKLKNFELKDFIKTDKENYPY